MGDRCWIQITFRRDELEKFENILGREFWDDDSSKENEFTAIINETNYGLYDERIELAEAGLTFYGNHGAGSDYGDCAFACFEGEHIEVNADFDGRPVVAILEDEKFLMMEMTQARNFWKIHKKVREYIEKIKET